MAKKQSTVKTVLITALLILASMGGVYAFLNKDITIGINPPKPVVVTSKENDVNSNILKEKATVYATIRNDGGRGNVLVTFHVSQAGNDYERSKSIAMPPNQSMDVQETFDEVHRLDGSITYSVDVKAE